MLPVDHTSRTLERDTMLRTDDLDYDLPERLIAAVPADRRDQARLLVLGSRGAILGHRSIADLPDLLPAGTLLILNDTRVIPARFIGHRTGSGGAVSGLFVEAIGARSEARVMLKSNSRLRPGQSITLHQRDGSDSSCILELIERLDADWRVRVHGCANALAALDEVGLAPLPPYILRRRARDHLKISDDDDRRRYQTVYADSPGAVAAPTAGLHFTSALLNALAGTGVTTARVTLHVGPGTFKPVESENIEQHPMHAEHYIIRQETIDALREARRDHRPVIPVGTTCVRALESLPENWESIDQDIAATTRLLITPGFNFRFTDGLLTNFHLPRSTLLALVAARIGLGPLRAAYQEAREREYRFYSYGDAMLIAPDEVESRLGKSGK